METQIFFNQLDVLMCVGFGLWPVLCFYKLVERGNVILPRKSTVKVHEYITAVTHLKIGFRALSILLSVKINKCIPVWLYGSYFLTLCRWAQGETFQ